MAERIIYGAIKAESGHFFGDILLFEERLQFTALEHVSYNIATANKLALDIKLRHCRPLGKILDTLTDFGAGQNIGCFEINAHMAEDLNNSSRKTALREQLVTLHEKHDRICINKLLNLLENDFGHGSLLFARVVLGL